MLNALAAVTKKAAFEDMDEEQNDDGDGSEALKEKLQCCMSVIQGEDCSSMAEHDEDSSCSIFLIGKPAT